MLSVCHYIQMSMSICTSICLSVHLSVSHYVYMSVSTILIYVISLNPCQIA